MKEILDNLKIKADIVSHSSNGTVSKYNLRLRPGEKVAKIERCINEIALGLRSYSVPLVRMIPQEGLVSVEVLNSIPQKVEFGDIKGSVNDLSQSLPVALGKRHNGGDLVFDLVKAPHLLVAGTTGSGKSMMLHSIICSLLVKDNTKLVLVDPKNIEFNKYGRVKQLYSPVINYTDDAYDILEDLAREMERRFKLLGRAKASDISKYNRRDKMPYIVVVIDEYADLIYTAKKKFQTNISRLAQKSRACGIHIVIATQRPSAEVVTGIVKANFPARISCKVVSSTNSRVVLGQNGAERLLGRGDALINANGLDMVRFQGAFVSDRQIESICEMNEKPGASRFFDWLRRR